MRRNLAREKWVNLLPSAHRELAILRLSGLTNKEIAAELDCMERKLNRVRSTRNQRDAMSRVSAEVYTRASCHENLVPGDHQ